MSLQCRPGCKTRGEIWQVRLCKATAAGVIAYINNRIGWLPNLEPHGIFVPVAACQRPGRANIVHLRASLLEKRSTCVGGCMRAGWTGLWEVYSFIHLHAVGNNSATFWWLCDG